MSRRKDIAEISSDKVRQLHDWWIEHSGNGGLPDRADFDPTAFPRLLPNILLSEVEADPFRIRYRLVGTKVADVLNIDLTGRYLDEVIDGGSDAPWLEWYRLAYENREAILGVVTEPTSAGDTFTFEFGIFPVTVGGDIRQFISIEDYFDFNLTSAELMPWSFRDTPAVGF